MSINNMPTIYELVDEVCARDFEILARLSTNQRNKFVDIIYSDILEGDSPEEITEDAIYDYVEEFIIKAISVSIDDVVDFNL
jgi:uncharacterized protein YuzB (UPF0349 family)